MGAYARAVAKAVKTAAENQGISGSAIGRHLGRAQSYASTRLNGRRAWTTDEVDQIAALLGVTVERLWESAREYRNLDQS